MQGDMNEAAEARDALMRLRPDYTLTLVTQNSPATGKLAECLRECMRKAGVPDR
jgi:hypothetical protein